MSDRWGNLGEIFKPNCGREAAPLYWRGFLKFANNAICKGFQAAFAVAGEQNGVAQYVDGASKPKTDFALRGHA